MKVVRFPILVVFVFVILSHSTAAYPITIEEFLEKHPDAVVALCVDYHENGPGTHSSATSGFFDDDHYVLAKSNLIRASTLYQSKIVPGDIWVKLIDNSDNYCDLLDYQKNTRSYTYTSNFMKQELVPISDELGFFIIDTMFDGFFDGSTTQEIREDYPVFYLQLSTKDDLYLDTEDDANMRIKGIDPTPPIY